MKIFDWTVGTGATDYEDIKVSEGFANLIIVSDLKAGSFANEMISIQVKRAPNNLIIATKIPLKDFVLASTFGEKSIQSTSTYATIAVCPLGQLIMPDGRSLSANIDLADGQEIFISLNGCNSAKKYGLYGTRAPLVANHVYQFESRIVPSADTSKRLDTRGLDLCVMTTHASIDSITPTFSNGARPKWLPFELETESRDMDPIVYNDQLAINQNLTGKVVFPLGTSELYISELLIDKTSGTDILFVFRNLIQD